MEELTIEEKAKAYDEALAKAVKIHRNYKGRVRAVDVVIEEVFSELQESEDERIRKELLEHCKNQAKPYIQTGNKCPKIQSWIDWLEKQGEQKSFARYKVGDTIYYNSFGEVKSMIVANITTDSTNNPMYEDENGNAVFEEDLIEQKSAWTPMDEQHVENLLAIIEGHGYPGEVVWLNSLKDRVQSKQKNPVWSKEDDKILKSIIINIENLQFSEDMREKYHHIPNANKSYYQIKIDWLKSLKDRVQPMQEWSGIDKDILFRTIDNLRFLRDDVSKDPKYSVNVIDIEREVTWLKSLRPQSQWKPSGEQINALYDVLNPSDGVDKKALESLYEQLKKL